MSEAEVLGIRQRVRSLLKYAAALSIGTLMVPLGLGVLWLSLGLWVPVGAVVLALSPIAWCYGILASIDRLRRSHLLRREIRNPQIADFETHITSENVEDVLRTLRLRKDPPYGQFVFSICTASGRLHSVAGQSPSAFTIVTCQLVADPPPTTPVVPGPNSLERHRTLSPEECLELRRGVRDAWRKPLYSGIFWMVLGLIGAIRGPSLYSLGWWNAIAAAAFASAGIIVAYYCLIGFRRARRLKRDLNVGHVHIAVAGVDQSTESRRTTIEVLPCSDELWTVDSTPADWRTASAVFWR